MIFVHFPPFLSFDMILHRQKSQNCAAPAPLNLLLVNDLLKTLNIGVFCCQNEQIVRLSLKLWAIINFWLDKGQIGPTEQVL